MKPHLLIAFGILLCSFISCAPSRPAFVKNTYPHPFEFELVDTATGSKNELYVKAHEWISKSYKSAKTVIDMQDKEAGKLIGKAGMSVNVTLYSVGGKVNYPSAVSYVMTIDVKDNKYRCVVSGFYHTGGTTTIGNTTVHCPSYGNLERDSITNRSEITYKQVVDKDYYKVKNQVMDNSLAILDDLKAAMHKPAKDF